MDDIGQKIRHLREDKLKISQTELVDRLNQTRWKPDISRQSHISNIENSTGDKLPSIRVLAAMAEVLETNTDYLLGLTDDEKPASDLDDQVVVGVKDPVERQLVQEAMDLLRGKPRDEQRYVVDLVRRLVGPTTAHVIGREK